MAHHAPSKGAQMARRVFGVDIAGDDTAVALDGIARLRAFFKSLGLPLTFAELGVTEPDIPALVECLHRNKGAQIGGYYRLDAAQTEEIYRLCI